MADILQITEDIPVDDSIYDYEYKEYNPIAGTDVNRGSIVITIEAQDIYTHPAESFLIIDGSLRKRARDNAGRVQYYDNNDTVTLINNGMMYLFSDVRYHLASHEIEVLQNPGQATTMLGLLKYPDDFTKSQGLNQVWLPDTPIRDNNVANKADNTGFKKRFNYLINEPVTSGNFSFKIPLKHFLGFCEDYRKILYGMQQKLTLTRSGNIDDPIFRAGGDEGEVYIDKIRWFMPHVIPSDAYRLQLDKVIEKKEKIPVGYRMLQCDSTQVPANSMNFTWRLGVKSSPDIPRFIKVGFQHEKNNNQTKNPAIFNHLSVRNIYVTLNAKRYPDTDYDNNFTTNNFSRIYGDASLFRKKFFNMDELVSNSGIEPIAYKNIFLYFCLMFLNKAKNLKRLLAIFI